MEHGDATNKTTTSLDAADVTWDPQINLGPSSSGAAEGYFVYCKFHSAASGTNITVRAFYSGLTGNGAAAAYYPVAAQWDNIAVTKASEFVPPTYTTLWFTKQPGDRTVAETSSLQISAQVLGGNPMTFQWYRSGQAVPSGTDRLLTLTNVRSIDAGSYTLVVSNSFRTITSLPALLMVRPLALPNVLVGPITNPANGHLYYALGISSWVEAELKSRSLGRPFGNDPKPTRTGLAVCDLRREISEDRVLVSD